MIPSVYVKYSLASTPKTLVEMGAAQADVNVAKLAYVTTTGNGIWFRFDTQAGSPAADDHYLAANETIILEGEMMVQYFRAISATGTAKVAVTLCR